MVQSEIYCRVLRMGYSNKGGTCFTIENHGEQFLVTAKHIFKDSYPSSATIRLLLGSDYQMFDVDIQYPSEPDVDIAVMKLKEPRFLTPIYNNANSSDDLVIGQQVYFLGFPFEYDFLVGSLPDVKMPIPFVKQACVSAVLKDGVGTIILDGINNPGFSGGPVCYKAIGSSETSMRILGVVSSYRFNQMPLFDKDGNETDYYVKENTGLIFVSDIKYANQIVENWV